MCLRLLILFDNGGPSPLLLLQRFGVKVGTGHSFCHVKTSVWLKKSDLSPLFCVTFRCVPERACGQDDRERRRSFRQDV